MNEAARNHIELYREAVGRIDGAFIPILRLDVKWIFDRLLDEGLIAG
jgi:hypothetical protein